MNNNVQLMFNEIIKGECSKNYIHISSNEPDMLNNQKEFDKLLPSILLVITRYTRERLIIINDMQLTFKFTIVNEAERGTFWRGRNIHKVFIDPDIKLSDDIKINIKCVGAIIG